MSKFVCRCAKCNSASVYLESSHRLRWETEKILSCYMCGWAVYGSAKVEAELCKQYAVFEKVSDTPTPVTIGWGEVHAREQSQRKREGKCAQVDCGGLARRESTYCSRECCVKNAHYRERKRKEGTRKSRVPSLAAA